MIPFEQALQTALSTASVMPEEGVRLAGALNRVLHRDAVSDVDVPAADVSAVDGYACRVDDRHGWMRLVETIAAGRGPLKTISYGECSKVMAGAIIPEGTECVAVRECAEEKDGFVRIHTLTGEINIRRSAAEVSRGHIVAPAGTRITPQVMSVLALAGADPVTVFCRPRVSVICTGDELVEPGLLPAATQTRNCNAVMLCAQIAQTGCVPLYRGIARDTPESTRHALVQAMGDSEVVIFCGGVSQGEFDMVPDAMRRAGVTVRFEGVAMHPGTHTLFGTYERISLFALPGDPVSAFIAFEVLVRPVLRHITGCDFLPQTVWVRLAHPLVRRDPGLLQFYPVVLEGDNPARVCEAASPADIQGIIAANGLVALAPDADIPAEDDDVEVMLLGG